MTERPTKRRRIQDFIEHEATVARDEEEEEEGEEENDFIDNEEELSDSFSGAQMSNAFRAHEQRRSEKRNLIHDLEKRYVEEEDEVEVDEDEEVGYDVPSRKALPPSAPSSITARSVSSGNVPDKSTLLPTTRDPSLFMLKCKVGKEKEIALTLMQKYVDYLKTPQPLLITGVVALDNLQGYIYIEAIKEAHVRKAIEGVDMLSQGRIKMVPLNEMTQVMEIPKEHKGFPKVNDWVRMTRGVYKEDLARVLEVDEARGNVTVQLVPRLKFSGQPSVKGQKPPKRLFNKQEVADLGGYIEQKRDLRFGLVDIYEGERYVEGFLHKVVSVKGIKTKNVDPQLEEIQLFSTGNDTIHINNTRTTDFREGDYVRVVEGDLKDLVGTIQSVNKADRTVEILPNNPELGDQFLTVDMNEIAYNIDIGSFVQVTAGTYQGETGDVVAVDGYNVILYSREKNKEMEVFITDIKQVSHVTTNESYRGYSLHDLVKLSSQLCGVIIHVGNNFFKILDNQGNVKSYKLQEIQGKMRKEQISKKDPRGNFISRDDEIKVISGNHAGVEGVVKHIFRNHLFCFSRDVLENNGMFVTSPMNCEVKGVVSSNSTKNTMPAPTKTFARAKINVKKQGETVRITKGTYKGYVGTVKGAGANNILRIELHSQPKIINIEEKDVKVIKAPTQQKTGLIPSSGSSYFGTETPFNRYGSHTPSHTVQTPSVGYTPSTPGGWDKNVPNTPHLDHTSESSYSTTTPSVYGSGYRGYSSLSTTTPGIGRHTLPTTPGIPSLGQPPQTPGIPDSSRYPTTTPGAPSYGQQRPTTPGFNLGDSRYGSTPSYNLGRQNPTTPGFGQSYPPTTPNIPYTPGIPSSYPPTTPGIPSSYPPTTPGIPSSYPPTTPGIPSSYPPTTPGVRSSIPQTPGLGNTGSRSSLYGYGQGRSMVPQTPGIGGSIPTTPGLNRPTTPGIPSLSQSSYSNDDSNSWLLPGVEVVHQGKSGEVIESRGSDRASIRFQDGEVKEVDASHLKKPTPKLKVDKVVVLKGNQYGKTGTISHISESDSKSMCVVQFDQDSEQEHVVVPLDDVAKLSDK